MSTSEPLSLKQCVAIKESDARLNIWQGAVRSGKTFSSLLKFIKLLRQGPPGNVMIIGVTRDSIQRNILSEICDILGTSVPGSKSTEMKLLGRQVYFVGANDESAVRRIQGSTLSLAYVDEAAAIPEPFWNMLLSRLSVPGAQLIATCNPASPLHWLKTKYLDRIDHLDLKTWKFVLDDNPALTEDYKDNLKREYTGMWYKRYILGEWAVAEGLVFDTFDQDNILSEAPHQPSYKIAGIDFGMTNPTAAVLLEVNPKKWPQLYVSDIYYFDSKAHMRSKTVAEIADEIRAWLLPHQPRIVYIDPSAVALRLELNRQKIPTKDAINDVLPGIQTVGKFIGDKNLQIKNTCKKLIEELQTYSWDPKAAERGTDKPIKENDHLADALRYACATHFPKGTFGDLDKDFSIQAIRQRAYNENQEFNTLFDGGYSYA